MTDHPRSSTGHPCPPDKDPAPQPHPPGDTCDELPKTTPPDLKKPAECPPDPCCKCPPPSTTSNCLEELIATQTARITAGDKAKAFKTDLETLQGKVKTANQEYTREKYETLVKEWKKQDGDIAELIRKLVCAVPCWRCIIECHVCPLLNELHYAEQWLYGDGTLYSEVHNLYDLRYWHERDRDAKQRRFERIKSVLATWENPVQTIEKALAANATLIVDAGKALGSDAGKVVYDVFLRLVPMHLAIAPPSGSPWTTAIDKEYTQFCACDEGTPDDCCGPDVGEWSLRQRLIGPQPYLIDPNYYLKVICCLVDKRYRPANDALTEAEAAFQSVDERIKGYKKTIEDDYPKSFDQDAKGAIPSVVDCCDYEPREEAPSPRAR